MEKDLIKDGDRVRSCDSNIAKMNVFTYHIHFSKWYEIMYPFMPPENFIRTLIQGILFVLQIIPLGWIVSLVYARNRIKRSKKVVAKRKSK